MNGKKKIRIRYRLSVVFFGSLLIFGIVFYRYMKTVTLEDVLSEDRQITFFNHSPKDDEASETEEGEGDTPEDAEEEASAEIVNPVPESEKAEDGYLDSCVFIGDSITYGLSSYGVVPSSNVLASVSLGVMNIETETVDTSYGEITVIDALSKMTPQNIYVMLGSTGAAYTSPTDMYQKYQSFLNRVRTACPEAEVYIISTPPVTSSKENSAESPIKNSDLNELNSKLLEYADTNGIRYLDFSSYIKDGGGYLPADCAENDGLHFKRSTYDTFTEYILTHIAK